MCSLRYGDFPASDGIAFNVVVEVPPRTTGQFEFVQDVIPFRKRIGGPSGGPECLTSNGQRVLDTQDPYVAPWPAAPGRIEFSTNDSPSSPLPFYERVEVLDSFRMFLMWRDDDAPLVRVTLGKIEWAWQGVAEACARPGDCSQGKSAWACISNGQAGTDWSPGDSPVLNPNLTDLNWQPC